MLVFNNVLEGLPIASLHAGHKIAEIVHPVINPDSLKIVAFVVNNFREPTENILLIEHVRDHQRRGILIDHAEDLSNPDDLLRLQELLSINYQIAKKKVITEDGKKIGIATGYSFNPETFIIQKIMVEPRGLKILRNPDRLIDRTNIVKTSDKLITIKEDTGRQRTGSALRAQLQQKSQLRTEAAQTTSKPS